MTTINQEMLGKVKILCSVTRVCITMKKLLFAASLSISMLAGTLGILTASQVKAQECPGMTAYIVDTKGNCKNLRNLEGSGKPQPLTQKQLTVMSRNVYHGVDAEISSVLSATSLQELLNRVADVYQGYATRNFPERAQSLAAEIEVTQPVLIGLQEAVLVRTGPFNNPAPAETVAFDYVQVLLNALSQRGLHYTVIADNRGLDVELPSALGFDVRHTDREVILARTDIPPGLLRLSNSQIGDFTNNCQFPLLAGQAVTVQRGWASVDVWTRGRTFRFISTHLEANCPSNPNVRVKQAKEVLDGPAQTSLPVVLVGDINSSPIDPSPSAYRKIAHRGFVDAWNVAGNGSGFTCCQDGNLLNPESKLNRRIDVVFFRGAFSVRAMTVTGNTPASRVASGLWPSDHAGVVATLEIP